MGDRGGIGPEVILKALSRPDCPEHTSIIYGDPKVMEDTARSAEIPFRAATIGSPHDAIAGRLNIVDEGSSQEIVRPEPSAVSGHAAVACIRRAVADALAGRIHGLVTGPVSKESLRMAGYPWPGHTDLLAELAGVAEYAMMLTGGPLRVVLVTAHIPLRQVPERLTGDRIVSAIRLAYRAGRMLGFSSPRVAVAGLNPHAGEGGVLGQEESQLIQPAIARAVQEGLSVAGPIAPDVVFRKAYQGAFDLVVVMYHDQGLIPLKMIAFETGVNITVGLPFIRTSPDHGTAFDIAGKNCADAGSMLEAIRTTLSLHISE